MVDRDLAGMRSHSWSVQRSASDAPTTRRLVLHDTGGHLIEGGAIGFLEGHRGLAGKAHHQHHGTVHGHLHHALYIAASVSVFNRHKIVPVEFRRTLQLVVGPQRVLVPFAEVARHVERVRYQPVAIHADQIRCSVLVISYMVRLPFLCTGRCVTLR